MARCLRNPKIEVGLEVMKLKVENGVLQGIWSRRSTDGNCNLRIDGNYGSRVEARAVETRDDESIKMGLLFIVARCLRWPITDSVHRSRGIECRGLKVR